MRRHIDKIEGAKHERGYVYSFHYHLIWCTIQKAAVYHTGTCGRNEELTLLCRRAE